MEPVTDIAELETRGHQLGEEMYAEFLKRVGDQPDHVMRFLLLRVTETFLQAMQVSVTVESAKELFKIETALAPVSHLDAAQPAQITLVQNMVGRWMLILASDLSHPKGWSGSRFVDLNGNVQISNFATEQDARMYAQQFGFVIVGVKRHL